MSRGPFRAMPMSPGRDRLESWLAQRDERLSAEQWTLLDDFLRRVAEQNEKVNITADSGEDLYLRHAADAFPALTVLKARFGAPPKILDLGAGAGFIGITLKIAWSEADVTVLESSYRKFGFLNHACAETKLRGLHALLGRAPQALGGRIFDAALVRAVARPEEAVRFGLRSVRRDGGLCLLYLSTPPEADPVIRKASADCQATLVEAVRYRLPSETVERHLAVFGFV